MHPPPAHKPPFRLEADLGQAAHPLNPAADGPRSGASCVVSARLLGLPVSPGSVKPCPPCPSPPPPAGSLMGRHFPAHLAQAWLLGAEGGGLSSSFGDLQSPSPTRPP